MGNFANFLWVSLSHDFIHVCFRAKIIIQVSFQRDEVAPILKVCKY